MRKLFNKLKIYLKPFLNWKFLLSYGIAYLFTNGWCYLFILFGTTFDIGWMWKVGTAYAAFLYFPLTIEKIITIPIAIFLQTVLFPRDIKLHNELETFYYQVKLDFSSTFPGFTTRRQAKILEKGIKIGSRKRFRGRDDKLHTKARKRSRKGNK